MAKYIIQNYGPHGVNLNWALAGKGRTKVERVKRRLFTSILERVQTTENFELEILDAGSESPQELDAICERAKIVIAAPLGPCSSAGTQLVESCLRTGTDYINPSAETLWMYDIIERFETEAIKQNVRIVLGCGGFSALTDLAVLSIVSVIRKEAEPIIIHYIGPTRECLNTGAIAALLYLFEPEHYADVQNMQRAVFDPLILTRRRSKIAKPNDQKLPYYSSYLKRW